MMPLLKPLAENLSLISGQFRHLENPGLDYYTILQHLERKLLLSLRLKIGKHPLKRARKNEIDKNWDETMVAFDTTTSSSSSSDDMDWLDWISDSSSSSSFPSDLSDLPEESLLTMTMMNWSESE